MLNYRIYARFKNQKNFYPVSDNGQTKKIIYAEHWPTLEKCKLAFEQLVSMNSDIEFKIFDVKNNKYIN